MSQIFIAASKDGWLPSPRIVRRLQTKARKLGLIWDWPTVAVLENHDLLLDCSHINGDEGAGLLAYKKKGKWRFKLD